MITHASFFSGIGGFDLAAETVGFENLLHCEINPICRRVLNYYWPNAKSYENIIGTDFTFWRDKIDILTGGFPCQPFSTIGKRQGTEDDRHLWPEMLRAIKEIKPKWVVGENVSGLVNWDEGVVFREVLSDLENEGYEVQAFIIPACATGAPHRRDRIWIIANSMPIGLQGRSHEGKETRKTSRFKVGEFHTSQVWDPRQDILSESPIIGKDDGISRELDGITFSNWRQESAKGFGNAIVPQVAVQIFKTIIEYENQNHQQR